MSKTISIGDIHVPLVDYAVGASAVLGIRDSGKTVTSKGIAEQLMENGVSIVVFDAVGKWRWMKVPAEKNGKAYKVVVAGGREPDLPLTPESVHEIVRAALKERIPLVIDLFDKHMSKADWRRIVQTAIHIIHYENEYGPTHVFLEEAAEFVPQIVTDGNTYAEVEKLVRMGGNASVGITLINQRSQEVNKAVLDNCSTALVLGCQVGKNAIKAVESWIEKLDPDTSKEVTTSLPKLLAGQAWVWTRKSLTKPSLQQMPMCRSYHPDRRTPEETLKLVAKSATDTASFVARISEIIPKVIEQAKANDPTELKRKLAETERKLRMAGQKSPEVKESEPIRVPVFDKGDREILTGLVEDIKNTAETLDQIKFSLGDMKSAVANLGAKANSLASSISPVVVHSHRVTRTLGGRSALKKIDRTRSAVMENGHSDTSINSTQQRILDALAWFESVGNNQPSTLQVGAVALIDSTGGYFSNMVGPLSANGLIDRGNGVMSLTDAGRKIAQVPDNISTLGDYHAMLCERVRKLKSAGGKTVEILEVIIAQGPDGEITTEEIGQLVQVDHTGGYFSNMIGPLGGLGLIERDRGIVRPTEILFPLGLA